MTTFTYAEISGTRDGTIELAASFTATYPSGSESANINIQIKLYENNVKGNAPVATQTYALTPTTTSLVVNMSSGNSTLSGTLLYQNNVILIQDLNACHSGFVQIFSPSMVVAVLS